MGFLLLVVYICDNMDLQFVCYCILMKGVEIGSGDVYLGCWLVINFGMVVGMLLGEKIVDLVFGFDVIWIESVLKEQV